MKKLLCTLLAAAAVSMGTNTAFANGAIPDHRGTPMIGIETGTASLSKNVLQYGELFEMAGDQYGVDPNLLAAICMQESSGRNLSLRDDGTEYPAWGIMQIEYTLEEEFADFGERTTGVRWTLEDRLDPGKAVPFAAWLISQSLYKYDCDYMKMIQAYNFGEYILDKIIESKGDEWLDERKNAVSYTINWGYRSYGDAEYIEHVLRYYHNYLSYRSAKIRLNGTLVKFEDQSPFIEDGRTLIPVRALSQTLGASVTWDAKNKRAAINRGSDTIIIAEGDTTAYINNTPVQLDVPARIINGRTMVPLRFAAETFGLTVNWDENTKTVELTD